MVINLDFTPSAVTSSTVVVKRLSTTVTHSDKYRLNCGAPDCVQPVRDRDKVARAAIWELDRNGEPIAGPANMHDDCIARWEQKAREQAEIDEYGDPPITVSTTHAITVAEVLDRDVTWNDYVSNVDAMTKQLGPNDVLVLRLAPNASPHRTPVHVWKVEL